MFSCVSNQNKTKTTSCVPFTNQNKLKMTSCVPIAVPMTSVWKRLQRVNKRAAKFQFTASFHQLILESTSKW